MIEVELALPRDASAGEVDRALSTLLELGALDVELEPGRILALFPGVASIDASALPGKVETRPARMVDQGNTWARKLRLLDLAGIAPKIDPGTAFGSGFHPTTSLCLERLAEVRPTGAVLDVGTGSGVLAIFALALGAERAVGIDSDPEALKVAAENARANKVEARLVLRPPPIEGRFSTITANIVPAVLTEIAPKLVQALEPKGRVILSGLMARHKEAILATYRDLGLRPSHESERSCWCCLELRAPW
jgi:ribosomal protein L11 methylase PrmA